ncbi:hypothetical protein M758_3G241900 [Ceratodon purpureus]|nr:hypothetical protein M758_3G241900 [Ceratodon purpureus]
MHSLNDYRSYFVRGSIFFDKHLAISPSLMPSTFRFPRCCKSLILIPSIPVALLQKPNFLSLKPRNKKETK